MARHNWEHIEDYYIRGHVDPTTGESMDLSIRDICKIFNVKSTRTVKLHIDKDNWRAKRKEYKTKLNETINKKLNQIQIPSIIETRKLMLNNALATVRQYATDLKGGEVQIRPKDNLDYMEFIIKEYNMIFGIDNEPAKPSDKPPIQINIGELDDNYGRTINILNRKRNGEPEED